MSELDAQKLRAATLADEVASARRDLEKAEKQIAALREELKSHVDQGFRNFLETAAEMMRAQKDYFRSKDQNQLVVAKRLESAMIVRLGCYGVKV